MKLININSILTIAFLPCLALAREPAYMPPIHMENKAQQPLSGNLEVIKFVKKKFQPVMEDPAQTAECSSVHGNKIAIVSHAMNSRYRPAYLKELTANHQQYAQTHGYDYLCRRDLLTNGFIQELGQNDEDLEMGFYWQKIQAVSDALAQDYQWVVYVEALNGEFTNTSLPLEDFIRTAVGDLDSPSAEFVIAELNRQCWPSFCRLDNNVLIVHNSPESREHWQNLKASFKVHGKNTREAEEAAFRAYVFKEGTADSIPWAKVLPANGFCELTANIRNCVR